MPKIVISYRRDDTGGISGRIYDRLAARYGSKNVFRDIDAHFEPGIDFRGEIDRALKGADALVCVIGPFWTGSRQGGESRIMGENDWVRVEVETALERKIPVVPLLIDDTILPTQGELPESLHQLPYLEAVTVSQFRDFDVHVKRLIVGLDHRLKRQRSNGTTRRWMMLPSAIITVAGSILFEHQYTHMTSGPLFSGLVLGGLPILGAAVAFTLQPLLGAIIISPSALLNCMGSIGGIYYYLIGSVANDWGVVAPTCSAMLAGQIWLMILLWKQQIAK